MLVGFRDAVKVTSFAGKYCADIAMGIRFLETMIGQAHGQLMVLKEAAKAHGKAPKTNGKPDLNVISPNGDGTPPEANHD